MGLESIGYRDVASEYVSTVIAEHAVRPAAVRTAEGMFPLLQESGRSPAEISLSGSHAKGTATALGMGVDVLVSVNEVAGQNIKDIYWRLFHWLGHKGLRPKARNVSLRVEKDGLAVDIVPGRIRSPRSYEFGVSRPVKAGDAVPGPHTLYWRNKDSWVQTNVRITSG